MDLGQRADHAAVSFIGHRKDRAGLRDCHVGARYAHIGMCKFLSHHLAGGLDLLSDDGLILFLRIISEQIRNLLLVQVQRRHDHMYRGVSFQRDDELAEVSLLNKDAVVSKDLVHVQLFRCHRLGLDDRLHPFFPDQVTNILHRLFRAGGMENMAAAGGAVLRELLDHLIDMIRRVIFYPADIFSCLLKINAFIGFQTSLGIGLAEFSQRSAERRIAQSRLDLLLQSFIRHYFRLPSALIRHLRSQGSKASVVHAHRPY